MAFRCKVDDGIHILGDLLYQACIANIALNETIIGLLSTSDTFSKLPA